LRLALEARHEWRRDLLNTLTASGVEVCFTNPGTSEMQLVAAIGNCQDMRAILCLFEGVVAGAADGYGRMSDKPALTLLHVGSGFANSMANQHNAMRAHVPLVNLVGDHATWHLHTTPMTSDVAAYARISSGWVRVSGSADDWLRPARWPCRLPCRRWPDCHLDCPRQPCLGTGQRHSAASAPP
jgi:thiamine pyrophosphate-dependent acetolactate synthase large subunit-like protein